MLYGEPLQVTDPKPFLNSLNRSEKKVAVGSDALSLEADEEQTYSFIIRRDGSYVIRSSDAFRNSYFDRVLSTHEDVNGMTPEEYLTELGLTLDWAENGKLCLEMFQAAAPGYYDAILMDIRMPVMNGYETTRAIRALDRPDARRIPIIAMTADAFSEDVKRCLDCGMDAHAAKPIDVKEIASLLGRLLKSSARISPPASAPSGT